MVQSLELPQKIEEYTEEFLPEDDASWCERYSDKSKIIHDSLWGTFRLESHEVALLDTPLIQRLRFLHQTGAVFQTYPSAHHTRFEHTLGVLYHAGRLCQALESADDSSDRVDKAFKNNVRFAALLHDTGHGPFSHTSEQFFASLPQLAEFREAHPELEHSGAGEILSYLIVKSARFRKFVDALNAVHRRQLDCERIAQAITGTMPSDMMYMGEIIHGPFDADKLDYMLRASTINAGLLSTIIEG